MGNMCGGVGAKASPPVVKPASAKPEMKTTVSANVSAPAPVKEVVASPPVIDMEAKRE